MAIDQERDEEIKRQVLEYLDRLDVADKERVLELSSKLASRRRAAENGGSLLAFAGSISRDDLTAMRQAIDEE